uniref:Uncharacterized protein n=1 Tax=Oryza glumipatula TaxID=40148 RepID=A0A0D9Z3Y0_9ORYZ
MAQPEKVSRRRRSIPAASRGVTGGEPPNKPLASPLGGFCSSRKESAVEGRLRTRGEHIVAD